MLDVGLPLDRDYDMPKRARAFVTEHLTVVDAEVLINIVLLTSELVTNVVVHGDTPAHLQLVLDHESVRVLVHDSGAGTPVIPPSDPAELTGNGRGLVIVAALSRSWGIAESVAEPGKDVWFDIDVRPGRAAMLGDDAAALTMGRTPAGA